MTTLKTTRLKRLKDFNMKQRWMQISVSGLWSPHLGSTKLNWESTLKPTLGECAAIISLGESQGLLSGYKCIALWAWATVMAGHDDDTTMMTVIGLSIGCTNVRPCVVRVTRRSTRTPAVHTLLHVWQVIRAYLICYNKSNGVIVDISSYIHYRLIVIAGRSW